MALNRSDFYGRGNGSTAQAATAPAPEALPGPAANPLLILALMAGALIALRWLYSIAE